MSKCPICGIPSLHLTDHECQEPLNGGSDQRLVRVVWERGMEDENHKRGPFTLWLIGDRFYHRNDDGTVGYFCGFIDAAESISDANK